MKIGLLTYHVSSNIGAMLQTYATCKALQQLGHEVVIVDIRQPERKNHGIRKAIENVVYVKQKYEHRKFRNIFYPQLTQRYLDFDELRSNPPQVDCLVVGSDQTWNPAISKKMSLAYFLDFGCENIKRFSYASSFGMDTWNEPQGMTEAVNKALHLMQFISVREKTAVRICKETFDLDAQLVVDPTLLFDGYPEITGEIPQNREFVCYKLHRNKDFFSNIRTVTDEANLPARLLNNSYPTKNLRYLYPPSVKEWIKRIGGAGFVLTDSFHGAVFSLLYQRQFAVIRNHNGRDQRFEDLLADIGLKNRLFDSVEQMSRDKSWKEIIDYSKVIPIIEKHRSLSWDYLRHALS